MGKTLVLAEKPSVGRELARVLGCRENRDGAIAGSRYVVTWALGHLVTLADPEVYGAQYKKWDLETLPMLPAKMELVVIKETAKQYNRVKTLLRSSEISDIVIATDAGREGELVARWIIEKANVKKPMKRLWISSQTDKAIQDGFRSLKDAKGYENLYHSAVCRAQADWVVGLNVTRALTCKYNAQLSAGRVQTPTLAMIAARETEIRKFVPQEYYTLSADCGGLTLLWKDSKTGQSRLSDRQRAEEIVSRLAGKEGRVITLQKQPKSEPSPQLYDLTELQRDGNKKYGYSAKETLNFMQRLYESHKALTYPRTDSRFLSADIVPTLPDRLRAVTNGPYIPFAREAFKRKITPSKRFVDNTKVTDHHAIIPTEQPIDLSSLSFDERRIYDLVVRRFLAVLSAPFEYTQTTIVADIGGERFTAQGKTVKAPGWKAIYGKELSADEETESEEKEQLLPELVQGQKLVCQGIRLYTGKTKPPAHYTEATLLSAMEHPEKFLQDGAMRSILQDAGGIGTSATRADIIEKLFSSSYVERRGREIFPLSKGLQLVDIVPDDLKSPLLTAKWEQQLSAIAKGQARADAFMGDMRKYASSLVRSVVMSDKAYRHDNLTRTRCPLCDKFMLEVNGKKGKQLICSDRECGHRQNLSFQSNARCPNCHKRLAVIGDGEKRIYSCPCGFREKYDRFNQELSERKASSSKRDVAAYLKKQEQSAPPAESAFAAALRKAKETQN